MSKKLKNQKRSMVKVKVSFQKFRYNNFSRYSKDDVNVLGIAASKCCKPLMFQHPPK